MSTQFSGVIPPVVVPRKEDRSLDFESYERSVNRMIEAGIHGLFVLGSSGEVAFVTDEERRSILQESVRIADGRVPVVGGTMDMQTSRTIENMKLCEDLGLDAVVATAPFYALGGPAETERHFTALREATDLPIFAYDLPVSVHVKLQPEMLVRLGRQGVIQGVKDSSGDDVSFRRLILQNQDAGTPLTLLTGHEVVVDGAYLWGADGSVPGLANVDPHGYVRQWDAFQRGDWAAVRTEQERLARLMDITSVTGRSGFGGGVGAFKAAMKVLGLFESNQMPEPVTQIDAAGLEKISAVLKQADLL